MKPLKAKSLMLTKSTLFIIISSITFSAIILLRTIELNYLSHDFVDYVAPVDALFNNPPGLYNTFWEIHPPMLYGIIFLWKLIMGSTMISFYFLYFIFLFLFLFFLSRIVMHYSNLKYTVIFQMILVTSIIFSNLFSMFFPVELVGTTFFLIAIYILRSSINITRVIFAFILFSSAILIKEVYLFASIFVFIYLIMKQRYSRASVISGAVIGTMLVSFACIGLLLYSNSLSAYLHVLSYKRIAFPISLNAKLLEQIQLLPYFYLKHFSFASNFPIVFIKILLLTSLMAIILLFVRNRLFAEKLVIFNIPNHVILLGFVLFGLAIGMVWQGKPLDGHYAISFVPFFVLFIFLTIFELAEHHESKIGERSLFLGLFLLIFFFTPNFEVVKNNMNIVYSNVTNFRSLVLKFETVDSLKDRIVKSKGCLQVAYGWSSGSYYHYSGLTPCSKYFLVELIALQPDFTSEFRRELLDNPPPVIVYNRAGAELDVNLFEKKVFPYKNIVENCYKQDQNSVKLYYAKFSSKLEMKKCFLFILQKSNIVISESH